MGKVSRIVLVGHCGVDAHMLRTTVQRALEGMDVAIESAQRDDELDACRSNDALWLVNRKLNRQFRDEDGVAMIARESQADAPQRMMLISDFEDAQNSARDAGALPGFGKRQLFDHDLPERLREVVRS